jgi:hypothetical protein
MELRAMKSTNIAQVGYDESTKVLRVIFNSGSMYDYFDVDPQTYRFLLQSPSKGGFFHKYIKNNFRCEKVE